MSHYEDDYAPYRPARRGNVDLSIRDDDYQMPSGWWLGLLLILTVLFWISVAIWLF